MAVTQAQFEKGLAERLGIPKNEAIRILEIMEDEVFKGLKAEKAVVIRGLGRFKINETKARTGRNPATGEPLKIKAGKKLKVLPPKPLKEKLKVR